MKESKDVIKQAFVKAIPITGSYFFVSMAYGLMMQESGYGWIWSLFTSLTVYTGAFQFVLVTFLSSGASFLTIIIMALFMNSRLVFYGLTFIEDFKQMGKRYPYMIHTMTDETYALNCSMLFVDNNSLAETETEKKKRHDIMFFAALFSRIFWMLGAICGGILGQVIPINLKGIDFCMTALFVTIFIDQWKSTKMHIPAILGIVIGSLFLIILGADYFLLPALILISGLLLFMERGVKCHE